MDEASVEALAAHVLTLPPQKRARLAELLLASLEHEETNVDAAWSVEIARRVAEIDVGAVATIPASEVFANLRHRFGK